MTRSVKQIETSISKLKGSGTRLQSTTLKLAIECLEHAADNDGDFTLITKLYHALPKMVRRASFKQWVVDHAPARFVEKKSKSGAKIKVFKKNTRDDAPAFDLAAAIKTPFYDYEVSKSDSEADPLTCEQIEEKVRKYIEGLTKKADQSGQEFATKLLEKMAGAA